MGVWEFSEQTPVKHSCDSSLWLNQDPSLSECPATFLVQLNPCSNIAFPSKNTALMDEEPTGSCQSTHTSTLLRASRSSFSLVCYLRERGGREGRAEAGREGERERERGRKDRSFTKREQHREKHLLELPLTRSSWGIFWAQQLQNTLKIKCLKSLIIHPYTHLMQTKPGEPRFWVCKCDCASKHL